MPDIAIFFLGLGSFILAIVGVVLGRNASAQEKNAANREEYQTFLNFRKHDQ